MTLVKISGCKGFVVSLIRFIQVFAFGSSSMTFLIDTFFKIVDRNHRLLLHMRNFDYNRTPLFCKEKGKSLLTRIL